MFFSAALLALPVLAQSAYAATCNRQYTIQDGDYCDSISAAHNVSTYQLSVANPAIDSSCSNLAPQTTICLGYSGEDCSTTYVVTADDTCDVIASNNGLNSTILYLNNPQINSDCTNIYIGEVLCVSNTVQVPPTPTGALPGATIPATATPAKATTTAASTTSAASSTSTATHAASNSASEDDDDDDDLPYCDEL